MNTASSGASGTFDLVFNNRIYPSIPVNILPTNLANLLQSSSDFGYLNVKRTGDCTGYTYTIEWIANGGAKSTIAINNTNSVTPVGTTVTASRLQSGGVFFKPLSGDLTRTYNINPQVQYMTRRVIALSFLRTDFHFRSKYWSVDIHLNVLVQVLAIFNGYQHKRQQ